MFDDYAEVRSFALQMLQKVSTAFAHSPSLRITEAKRSEQTRVIMKRPSEALAIRNSLLQKRDRRWSQSLMLHLSSP